MKALNYILAVLLLSIFFVACTAETFEEQDTENAALIEYDRLSKITMTLDETQETQIFEEEQEAPSTQWRDPSEDEDDMPDPNGKDPSEDEDDMPDPNTMP